MSTPVGQSEQPPKLAERQAEVDALLNEGKEQPPAPLKTIVSKPPLRWTSDPWCLLGLFAGSVLLGYGVFTFWRWVMAPARPVGSVANAGAVAAGLQQQALEFARRIAAGASEVDQILSAAAKST